MLFSNEALEFMLELDVVFNCLFYLAATIPVDSIIETTVLGIFELEDFEYACFEVIGLVPCFRGLEERLGELHDLLTSRVKEFAEFLTDVWANVDV